jgi:sulfite reductase (NADPH) hemoprotein beta-component
MNALYKPSVLAAEIVPTVRPLLRRYAAERLTGERFGDFAIRVGLVSPTGTPADFHAQAAMGDTPGL